VLFSRKNCKNHQTLEDLLPNPLASGGWKLRLQTHTSIIMQCKFFFLHLPKRLDLLKSTIKALCSCNYNGSAPGFRRRKNYAAFLMSKTTEIIIIGFSFFILSAQLILRWRRPWALPQAPYASSDCGLRPPHLPYLITNSSLCA